MRKAFVFSVFLAFSCQENQDQIKDKLPKFFDRDIYLSEASFDGYENTFFQKETVKSALQELESQTNLGSGYFRFKQVANDELTPVATFFEFPNGFKSFIQIWTDSKLNNFLETNDITPGDPYALTVINAANKRKFFIIFKKSCADGGSSLCNNIGTNGFKAMIWRQVGMLVGLSPSCTNPNSIMCTTPSDNQYSLVSRNNFINAFNNNLDNILNTPGFYPDSL